MRQASKRFIGDLKRSQKAKSEFFWSPGHANRACTFIEQLPHVKGNWEKATIVLHPSQIFFVTQLFGFRRASDGRRRFTEAVLAMARKNAKSTLAAGIMLYCLCFEDEVGAEVISAATTGKQARIVFDIAKQMIDRNQDLAETFELEPTANAIFRYDVVGNFRPINSKASTQDGLNPSHTTLDEIHAHKTRDLMDVLRSAEGARTCPLFIYTTTEGYESPGPWPELRQFAHNVLDEVVEANHFLVVYYSLDDEDDDYDESKWQKANPLWDVNPSLREAVKNASIAARNMPGSSAEFRIKRLNRRSSTAKGWTDLTRWRKCSEPFDPKDLEGAKCWAGWDGANTTDIAAWRLLALKDGIYYTWGRFWVPADAVAMRAERKSVNYAAWIQRGLITQFDGATNDYDAIERDVIEDIERFQPSLIAYDPWNSTQFVNNLVNAGVPAATTDEVRGLVQFRQTTQFYAPAMRATEEAYLNGNLRHGGDPVLTWHMSNVVPYFDSNMNPKPEKKRSPDKIDGACALFMAFGCASLVTNEGDREGFFANPVMA